MPWAETSAVQERIRFVKDYQSGLYPMTELCARCGVSRQTGYKWVDRYLEQGAAGLEDRSRAPHHCPHRMSPAAARAIVATRRRRPSWGLPRAIQTDNGSPFASRGIHGLSQLSVWWIELGIQPVQIEPRHPEQEWSA